MEAVSDPCFEGCGLGANYGNRGRRTRLQWRRRTFLRTSFFGMRITGFVLADEDVSAPGLVVETGASVPGYSGGLAACAVVSDPDLL